MASLIWGTMFVVLLCEAGVIALLLCPMPAGLRRRVSSVGVSIGRSRVTKWAAIVITAVTSLLLLDSRREYASIHDRIHAGEGSVPAVHHHVIGTEYARMFRAQRNTYICAITLFLLFVSWRLLRIFASHDLVPRNNGGKESSKPVDASAAAAADAFKRDAKKSQ